MAVTEAVFGTEVGRAPRRVRSNEAGTANTLLTASTIRGVPFKLLRVAVHYSGAVTQAGVTVTVNSGLGSNYDHVIHTGSADVQDTVYNPTEPDVLGPGDEIDVAAPAGGAGDVAYVVIMTEDL